MTRPEIVRADTLDLQDHVQPSAKDHTKQPSSPKPLGDGPPAPHQAQSLRKASLDGYDLHVRSPRASKDLSDKELQLLQDGGGGEFDEHGGDGAGVGGGMHLNGAMAHHHKDDMDMDDDDDEDDMDDEMMDKISSSPSIDDGGYSSDPPVAWPRRQDSLLQLQSRSSSLENIRHDVDDGGDETSSARRVYQPKPVMLQIDCVDNFSGGLQESHPAEEKPDLMPVRQGSGLAQPQAQSSRLKENLEDPTEDEDLYDSDLDALEDMNVNEMGFDPDNPLLEKSFANHESHGLEAYDGSDVDSEVSWQAQVGLKDDDNVFPENDANDDYLWADERFVDSGWGGECLREVEDIDFEFVYALHTFVATVEGQANATKGDTMVLLDDSNSYWWLVKVVKDSSIGYLPAEHIETPTERLARLNKHRNIDLSQTMLGDNPEKSRNPLKKAMRRRNAKTVQFTEPTYYEPSEPSYSDEEDEGDNIPPNQAAQNAQAQAHAPAQAQQQQPEDEATTVEPLRTQKAVMNGADERATKVQEPGAAQAVEPEKSRASTDTQDSRDEEVTGRRRMRNTDSFYKDDSVETRKISLTPKLLSEEGGAVSAQDPRGSLDSLKSNDKAMVGTSKKEEKKKKGVLGGFFKRKNSKNKQEKEEERDDMSGTTARDSPRTQGSMDSISVDSSVGSPTSATSPRSRLTKAPPPNKQGSIGKRGPTVEEQKPARSDAAAAAAVEPVRALSPLERSRDEMQNVTPAPLRVQGRQEPAPPRTVPQDATAQAAEPRSPTQSGSKGVFSNILSSATSGATEPNPEKTKKAKNRMALDDSDASEDESAVATPAGPPAHEQQPHSPVLSNLPSSLRPAPQVVDTTRVAVQNPERLSESPIEVSPVVQSQPAPSAINGSPQRLEIPPSPLSAASTPELVERPSEAEVTGAGSHPYAPAYSQRLASPAASTAAPAPALAALQEHYQQQHQPPQTQAPAQHRPQPQPQAATPSTTSSTTSSPVTAPSTTTTPWSPAALRTYLETEGTTDIRDLILLVHDTSDVKGLTPNHEMVKGFDGETRRLDGMQKKLDDMLGKVLGRRSELAA